jgi:hypothetical protein
MSDEPKQFDIEQWIENAGDSNTQASRWFGHFVAFYADVEGQCHVLFRRYCGVKEKVARSIAGGMRFVDLLQILSVIIAESDMADHGKQDFPLCIEQLNHLTAFRHRLVHRGFQRAPGIIAGVMGKFTSSNVLTARARESMETLNFHVDDIKAAAKDCLRIHARMQFMTIDDPNPRTLLEKPFFDEALYGPWFYKPLQPKKLAPKPRTTPE